MLTMFSSIFLGSFIPICIDHFLTNRSSLCPLCKRSVLPKGFIPSNLTLTNATIARERRMRQLRNQARQDANNNEATGDLELQSEPMGAHWNLPFPNLQKVDLSVPCAWVSLSLLHLIPAGSLHRLKISFTHNSRLTLDQLKENFKGAISTLQLTELALFDAPICDTWSILSWTDCRSLGKLYICLSEEDSTQWDKGDCTPWEQFLSLPMVPQLPPLPHLEDLCLQGVVEEVKLLLNHLRPAKYLNSLDITVFAQDSDDDLNPVKSLFASLTSTEEDRVLFPQLHTFSFAAYGSSTFRGLNIPQRSEASGCVAHLLMARTGSGAHPFHLMSPINFSRAGVLLSFMAHADPTTLFEDME